MADIKFSGFSTAVAVSASTIMVGAVTDAENIQFTPTQLAPFVGVYAADGTLASNRTINMGSNTLSLDQTGSFNHTVVFSGLTNAGMAITGGGNYIVSSDGSYSINSTTNANVDAISFQTNNGAGANASILINSRSQDVNADLHLKTATKLKIDLPVAAAVGYVLKADDALGNVSWAAQIDTGITGVTLAVGTGASVPLAESITSRELTITSNKYGGTNQVGYVPAGGDDVTFLRGDGAWETPIDTTNNAAGAVGQLQYTNGSGVFQATSDMVYTTDELKVQNSIYLDGNGSSAGIVKLGCEAAGASHYVGLEGPTHNGANAYIIKFPDATPTANQILKVNTVVSSTANMLWVADTDTNTNIANTDLTLNGSRILALGASQNLTFTGSGTSRITFSNSSGVVFDEDVTFVKNVKIQGQGYTELYTKATTGGFTPDWNDSNIQTMVLSATTTINNPTSIQVGATYILILKQPNAGDVYTVTFGSKYKFAAGSTPTITNTNAKADVITIIAYSADVLMCAITQDFVTS